MRPVISLLLLLLVAGSAVSAQAIRDSKGRNFWVAFPPNDHPPAGGEPMLAVFLSSDEPASVTIEARRRTGETDFLNRPLPARTVVKVEFDMDDYELRGAQYPNGPTGDGERVMPTSINIRSDKDITVYAVSRDRNTSDAWLVLPTESLGFDHRVMSYASDARADTVFGVPVMNAAFPSQFLVVATEDSTDINIDLSISRSSTGLGRQRSASLNRGDSYLVQAAVTIAGQNDDLTGSRIRSNKPVAVISSHFRAQVPVLSDDASRDMLVEQVPSVDTWGKKFAVPPLEPPTDAVQSSQTDVTVLRILAHEDSTMISINGWPEWRINGGTTWDLPLSRGRTIESNKPILVAIIDRSANRRIGGTNRTGDPSLTLIPPIEQYLPEYRVVSIEPNPGNPFYQAHYLTLIAPMEADGSLAVDGIQTDTLTEIVDTTDFGYGYVHVPVTAGQHEVTGDSLFGIIAYGYGPAESYGYTGGMAFERLYRPWVVLRVLDTMAAPGDSVAFTVVVDSIGEQLSFNALAPKRLTGEIEYDRTVFVPRDARPPSQELRGTIPFTADFDTLNIGDTVAVIHGRTVLGRIEQDSIHVLPPQWFNDLGQGLDIVHEERPGAFLVSELCRTSNGTRLFDPLSTAPVTRIYDATGRERPSLQSGLNIVVTRQGAQVSVQKVWR